MIKPYPIKYIDGKDKNGILIDWDAVRKEYRKLKIPKQYHYPLKPDFSRVGYTIDMSDRSRGKTTNKLIVGLILYAMYGIQLQYVRQYKDLCEPRMIKNLYETVIDCGYIPKIFGEQYNGITYRGKRWYLVHIDEDGKIDDKDERHCTFCCGLDESFDLKSSYNAPRGDLIFFDEFISNRMGFNDFTDFCDICKTIIRERRSPIIMLSANTINRNSRWFDEYAIRDAVQSMEQGDTTEVVSPLGTHFYIEILPADTSEERQIVNRRFFGFRNSKLASITGKGTWAEETYQHIPPDTVDGEQVEIEILCNRIFIEMSGQLHKLMVVNDPRIGVCVYVMPATRLYPDSVIFTVDDIRDKRYIFGFGRGYPVEFVWKLFKQGLFYYAHNAAGCAVASYITYATTKIEHMSR